MAFETLQGLSNHEGVPARSAATGPRTLTEHRAERGEAAVTVALATATITSGRLVGRIESEREREIYICA